MPLDDILSELFCDTFENEVVDDKPDEAEEERAARDRGDMEAVRAAEQAERARRPDMNDPRNWTEEQRRIAGMMVSEARVRMSGANVREALAAEGLDPDVPAEPAPRPARVVSEVEADRANRFRQSAELERAIGIAARAAEVLSDAEAVLALAKALAKSLGDEARVKEAEDLEARLQAIEETVEQGGQ